MPTTRKDKVFVTYNNRFIKTIRLNKERRLVFNSVGVSLKLGKLLGMTPVKLVFGYHTSAVETFEVLGFITPTPRHMLFLGTESTGYNSLITKEKLSYSDMDSQMFSFGNEPKKTLCLYGGSVVNNDTVEIVKLFSFPEFETPAELEMKMQISGLDQFLEKKNEWLKNHPPVTD